MGGAYLAGEQAALDGVPLHGVRSCQEPLGFQQPLLQPLQLLMETRVLVLVLDINTTQRLSGGAAVRSGETRRGGRRREKRFTCF